MFTKVFIDSFKSKVKEGATTDCWLWDGTRQKRVEADFSQHYGVVPKSAINDKCRMAHRVAYEIAHGPIPDGMLVRHKCDNPPCCNPNHLELGTVADNNRDARERNRIPTTRVKDLIWADAELIRVLWNYASCRKVDYVIAMSKHFNCKPGKVMAILLGKTLNKKPRDNPRFRNQGYKWMPEKN